MSRTEVRRILCDGGWWSPTCVARLLLRSMPGAFSDRGARLMSRTHLFEMARAGAAVMHEPGGTYEPLFRTAHNLRSVFG